MTALDLAVATPACGGAAARPTPRVIGLDLALGSTGVAGNSGGGWTERIKPPTNMRGLDRLAHIRGVILGYTAAADVVVVEGPSYGSSGAGSHERAGLWWLVAYALWKRNIPVAVAPPKCRAQYVTGLGDANKREVLAAVAERFPWFDTTRRAGIADEADALALAALGADWLGVPLTPMPATHRVALAGVAWPDRSAMAS